MLSHIQVLPQERKDSRLAPGAVYSAAEKQFTVADMVAQTQGVICRKDKDVIDEIPGAYKDIDQVMANQADLTEILHTLKQVVCVKG